jgi:hypothetical protein
MPKNEGVLNAIKRARQFTDINWTPPIDLPRICFETGDTYLTSHGELYADVFKAGVEYTGLPYSGRYKPYHQTSIDAFASCVVNENSIVGKATDSIGSIPVCYYGMICTGLTSYAMGIPTVNSDVMPNIDGLEKQFDLVGEDGVRHTLNDLELADLLVVDSHGAIITDIAYKNGEVEWVEIAEATRQGSTNSSSRGGLYGGLCRRIMMTAEEFYTWFEGFAIYRYAHIDKVTYTPNPYIPMVDEGNRNPVRDFPVMPYEGHKSRYRTTSGGPEVKLIINHDGYTHLRVKRDGEDYTYYQSGGLYELPTDGSNEITVKCRKAEGKYTAYLCKLNSSGEEIATTVSCMWYCNPAPEPVITVADNKFTAVVTMERNEFVPVCYAICYSMLTEGTDVTRNGYVYSLTNENMTVDTSGGNFVYTITDDLPEGTQGVTIFFESGEFGIMQKTTALGTTTE